jgi:hypothetical protein
VRRIYHSQANRELALKAANVVLNLPQDSVTDEMRERAKQIPRISSVTLS